MAPFDDNFQDDLLFQSLLSSQRKLLSRLKFENQNNISGPKVEMAGIGGQWAINTPNSSIDLEPLHHECVLAPKRTSLGVGNDNYVLPDARIDPFHPSSEGFHTHSDEYMCCGSEHGKKRQRLEDTEDVGEAKRRRHSLTFLNYVLDRNEPNDESEASLHTVESSDDEDYDVIVEDVPDDVSGSDDQEQSSTQEPNLRQKMIEFEKAMERSQVSQQKIHDWDRKMGLKRSHSKTMRLSSRSRKKLRQLMKKDITHLSRLL